MKYGHRIAVGVVPGMLLVILVIVTAPFAGLCELAISGVNRIEAWMVGQGRP
jgi:hypothetical protein